MTIRAVVLDIGGVLEISADGGEPSVAFGEFVARWERRLDLSAGVLAATLDAMQSNGMHGVCSLSQWQNAVSSAAGMNSNQLSTFMREFWDGYLGNLNVELAEYFRGLRPRYCTALLSNSFVGAREEEQERYQFSELTDRIVYSHEVGISKPERGIYDLTCDLLGVRAKEVIFLDDVGSYVEAARDAGMHAILFKDNSQAISEIEALLS